MGNEEFLEKVAKKRKALSSTVSDISLNEISEKVVNEVEKSLANEVEIIKNDSKVSEKKVANEALTQQSKTEDNQEPETELIKQERTLNNQDNNQSEAIKKETAKTITSFAGNSEAKKTVVSSSKKQKVENDEVPISKNNYFKNLIGRINDNDLKRYTAMVVLLFLIFSYTVGLIVNTIKNGKTSINPITNISVIVSQPKIFGLALILGLAAIVIFLVINYGKDANEDGRNINFSESDQYGSSGWMTREEKLNNLEIKNNAKDIEGIILGKEKKTGRVVALPYDSGLNRNFFIVGNQKTGKSWTYARNLITHCVKHGESIIVNDLKGELYQDSYELLTQNGYVVKVLNLKDTIASDAWNILEDLSDDDITIFCNMVITNTTDRFDAYYDNNEMTLLKALVLYVKYDKDIPPEDKTFTTVYKILLEKGESGLDDLFNSLDSSSPAKQAYQLFGQTTSKSGAILGLGTRINIMQNTRVQHIFGHSDIDVTLPAKKKCAYFVISSAQTEAYDFVSTMFFSYLFLKSIQYADTKENGKTDVPIHFILDEFSQIGQIPGFLKSFATVRSAGIGLSLMVQNLPQMYARWGEKQTEEIIGGCDINMLLGCNDQITADYYSKLCGEVTIEVETERKNLNSIRFTDYTHDFAKSTGLGKRPLMMPDEIRRLKEDNTSLLILSGQKPLRLDKFGFNENPVYLKWGDNPDAHRVKPNSHVPNWIYELKERTDFETKAGGVYGLKDVPPLLNDLFEKWRVEETSKAVNEGSVANKEPETKDLKKIKPGVPVKEEAKVANEENEQVKDNETNDTKLTETIKTENDGASKKKSGLKLKVSTSKTENEVKSEADQIVPPSEADDNTKHETETSINDSIKETQEDETIRNQMDIFSGLEEL